MARHQMRDQVPRLVRCELLTYVFSYLHRFPKEKLAKTVIKFYRTEEINLAKDLLWEFYEPQLGQKKLRHTKKETVHEMDTRDIIKAALELDKRQAYGKEVAFAATDLERLPKPSNEERTILAIIDRVSVLEAKMTELTKIKDTQLVNLKEDRNSSSAVPLGESEETGPKKGKDPRDLKETHAQKRSSLRNSRKDLLEADELDSGHDGVKLLGNGEISREKYDSYCETKKEQECIIS